MRYAVRLSALLVVGAVTLAVTAIALVPAVHTISTAGSYASDKIDLPPLGQRSLIYDSTGGLLGSFQDEVNRSVVKLADIPPTVVQSILAVEDSDFYHHGPIDLKSMARALQKNVKEGGVAQGGSTITQQVVKKSLTGDERKLSRKLKEGFLAVQLERQYTKDQILERYLNIVYFGNGAYGVQAAAEVYFNKDVGKLDWAEGAMLAALISNPNGYDPISQPLKATEQRGLALRRLVGTKRLSQAEADLAAKEPIPARPFPPPKAILDYFPQEVLRRLLSGKTPEGAALGASQEARYNAVFRGGLRIHTTYDRQAQALAIDAIKQSIPGMDNADLKRKLPDYVEVVNGKTITHTNMYATAAMASVEPSTGAVRVLVGGPPPNGADQLDLATDSLKQPGSSFKTIVLAAAMENGFVPNDSIDGTAGSLPYDDPTSNQVQNKANGSPDVQPCVNFSAGEGGTNTVTQQTIQSVNCAYWRLAQIVGLEKVIDQAKKLGITNCVAKQSPLELSKLSATDQANLAQCMNPWFPVMAFGGSFGVRPIDMAGAYAVFANDGVRNEPYFVDKITDAAGKVLYQHQANPQRVMAAQSARLLNQVLEANVQYGTGTRAQLSNGQDAAGKTGTTDEATNLWFDGYTPQLATSVWVGNPSISQQPPLGTSAQGGQYPAYTWGLFMNALLRAKNAPNQPFAQPDPTRGGTYLAMGKSDGNPFDPSTYAPPPPQTVYNTEPATTTTTLIPQITIPPPPSTTRRTTTTRTSGRPGGP